MPRYLAIIAAFLAFVSATTAAQNRLQGELELDAASRTERNAGVWLDGQYVGHVGDLRGGDSLVLVPGRHELLFRLIGYEDLRHSVTIEPGEKTGFRVSMAPKSDAVYPSRENTARLRFEVEPTDAAIFVDQAFAGHVDRFDGRGGMRIAPGTYRFTIALPGYESFQTELALREGQTYEIKTELRRGDLSDQAAQLIESNPGILDP